MGTPRKLRPLAELEAGDRARLYAPYRSRRDERGCLNWLGGYKGPSKPTITLGAGVTANVRKLAWTLAGRDLGKGNPVISCRLGNPQCFEIGHLEIRLVRAARLTPEDMERAYMLSVVGYSSAQIARRLGIAARSVDDILRRKHEGFSRNDAE
jgi:hypothetical protein